MTALGAGTHWVAIVVPDGQLYRFGESFQLTIQELTLVLNHEAGSDELGKIADLGQTGRYQLSQFELPMVAVAGEPSEQALDDDGDGLFDRLVVTVPVEKRREERYSGSGWSGRLEGASGKLIQYSGGSGPIKIGINALRLEFDGAKIRKANIDGPFFVRQFSLYGVSDGVSVEKLIETRAYRAEQFRGRPQLLPVKPAMGRPGETVTVDIRGSATSFSGETRVAAGESITTKADFAAGAELLRANFRIDPQAAPGPRTITVTTGSETVTLAEGFRVLGPGETGQEPPARKPPPKASLPARRATTAWTTTAMGCSKDS